MALNRRQRNRLGGLADLSSVLDSLYKIEHEKTRSKERIALQDIREIAATRRQVLRDKYQNEAANKRAIEQHNRDMLKVYSIDQLGVDKKSGEYVANEDAVTRDTMNKLELPLEELVGSNLTWGEGEYKMYKEAQVSSVTTPNFQYEGDITPINQISQLTTSDIPQLKNKVFDDMSKKYEEEKYFDPDAMKRVIDASISSRKDIIGDKELSMSRLYQAKELSEYANLGEFEEKETAEKQVNQKQRIKDDYQSPIYNAVYKIKDTGLDLNSNWTGATQKHLIPKLQKAFEDDKLSQGQINQYHQALKDIFENPIHDGYNFMSNFRKWNKQPVGGGKSVAEELFSYLSDPSLGKDQTYLTMSMYNRLDRLEKGKEKFLPIKDVSKHIDMDLRQVAKWDEWRNKFPMAYEIFHGLAEDGDALLETRGKNLVIRVKNMKRVTNILKHDFPNMAADKSTNAQIGIDYLQYNTMLKNKQNKAVDDYGVLLPQLIIEKF